MNRIYYLFSIIGLAFVVLGCSLKNTNNSYLGQELPGLTPQLFAPLIVNTDDIEINTVFNNSFTEVFFTRIVEGSFIIYNSELINGNWTSPKPLQMFAIQDSKSVAIDPSITQDGNTMYFLGISPEDYSNKPLPDIYKSQKIDNKWKLASKVEYPISTDEYAESYPVVVADGSLYFQSDRPGGFGKRDIYRAQYFGDGKFDIPVNIGSEVNSERNARSTYVSSDESYLITSNISEESGFYVSFNNENKWQKPIPFSLGEPLEKDWIYCCPYMSPDNKYLFFSKRYSDPPKSGWKGVKKGEVYWLDASSFINLKNE